MAIEWFSGKNRFLSNFWQCNVRYDGIDYPSVEHGFHAHKTMDLEERRRIALISTPGLAKVAGRSLVLRRNWLRLRDRIMYELVTAKFNQNEDLAVWLLDTDEQELVEGNTWNDTYWGVCKGKGENRHGKILMRVRGEL